MVLSQRIALACTILTTGILVAGFAGEGYWLPMLLVLGAGLLWLAEQWRWLSWDLISSIIFGVFTIAGAALVLAGFPAELILLTLIMNLIAWDLDYFLHRTGEAGQVDNARRLERRHLKRVAMTSGLGLILGGIALEFKIHLAFGWILLLVVVIIVLLHRLMNSFASEGK